MEKHPNKHVERRAKTCKYFNGLSTPCGAGCRYPRPIIGICVPTQLPTKAQIELCTSYEPIGVAEAEKEELEITLLSTLTTAAMKRCELNCIHIGKQLDYRGTVVCPKCNGTLEYIRYGLNGHLHGKCRTEKCLQWQQ